MLKLKDNLKDTTDEKLNASNVRRLCILRWFKTTAKTKHRQTCTQTRNGTNPRKKITWARLNPAQQRARSGLSRSVARLITQATRTPRLVPERPEAMLIVQGR